MSEISRATLFGKLDPLLFQSLESATAFCKLRGNPFVELVHWLHQLLQAQDSDLHRVLRRADVDPATLDRDIAIALDRLPRGAGTVSDLASHIDEAVERAWIYATLKFDAQRIRGGHLLVALTKTFTLRNVLHGISREFEKVVPDVLARELASIVQGSPEDQWEQAGAPAAGAARGRSGDSALAKYAVDLTERARRGEIDPVSGRDEEIRQVIDVLMRRRQNNPLLAGEAGVGKTAVAEGLALRLATGDVPPPLREVALLQLDIGLLQAGAGVKGEFEGRLRQVIDEVQASPRPVVLFIDEIHTLIGAGGAAGTGDAANLLKPALARGLLRTVGATTWAEYKKYIEKDPALTRRFQVIQVGEPSEEQAIVMLRGIAGQLEAHHRVVLLDEAIEAAVRLSHRYIAARQLPDKAVALLDTACARVAVSQHAQPPAVEDCRRRIEALEIEHRIAERERRAGDGDADRPARLARQIDAERAALQALEARWRQERNLAEQIAGLRVTLDRGTDDESAAAAARERLSGLQHALRTLQGEAPLLHPCVDHHAVSAIVADWTGIPVGRMVRDEAEAVLALADTLSRRVVGQRPGLEAIARRIQTSRARLDDPGKPVGVFLLCGPSGVGKTETALALAETLYGGEQNLITINMSEFQEPHTVSTLKGAPPGYVGYGEGGVLTEAVRRRPYSVVLLDELEKAHADVHELFFQVFDKGWMEDGEGRAIDFRNTVLILTTNVGTDKILALCADEDLIPAPQALADALRPELLKAFPAALLGRMVVVPYYPLGPAQLQQIVRLQLDRIRDRLQENHGIALTCHDSAVALVAARCNEVESGGRLIDAILTNTVLPRISRELLEASASGRALEAIEIAASHSDFDYVFTERSSL
ncbi:MAG: type VI secretion system ATPase TssH [Pigmentiphaga sp.]|uniref:type VI secretion system ATPase TssH n=1 Tax=Pigmentiphaga sp. TaxID=1977564 RepID=UPI0029AECE94|nr:type VI secretion system ATPase TssH [Pigmentiphaga sp.]MDX3905805.1 type VI secretion system ATPase TssH [Pigmentiphaga sp.]